jgi:Flp pilus assembly protein TadB
MLIGVVIFCVLILGKSFTLDIIVVVVSAALIIALVVYYRRKKPQAAESHQ